VRARRFERPAPPSPIDPVQTIRYRGAERLAQYLIRIAGGIYRAKEDEWWADLIYFQRKEKEAGLLLASFCLISSLAFAWPHVTTQITAWLVAGFFEWSASLVELGRRLVLRCAIWSPQIVAVAGCGLVGHVLPIQGVSYPEIASLVILAPAGMYLGTAAPRAVLGSFGAAAGALVGLQVAGTLGGNQSIPLFAGIAMLLGEKFGLWWADQVVAFKRATVRVPVTKKVVVVRRDAQRSARAVAAVRVATAGIMAKVPSLVSAASSLGSSVTAMGRILARALQRTGLSPSRRALGRAETYRPVKMHVRAHVVMMPMNVFIPDAKLPIGPLSDGALDAFTGKSSRSGRVARAAPTKPANARRRSKPPTGARPNDQPPRRRRRRAT
jgi:hypothetical protein